jgi:AraC-like DNA-binding protein
MMIVEDSCTILQFWETGNAGRSEEVTIGLMNHQQSEREARRAQAGRDELAERVARQIRLHEARRLMLGEDLDAASAGYRVGYFDASHFTREYKRLFGSPPARDVERMREAAMENASL